MSERNTGADIFLTQTVDSHNLFVTVVSSDYLLSGTPSKFDLHLGWYFSACIADTFGISFINNWKGICEIQFYCRHCILYTIFKTSWNQIMEFQNCKELNNVRKACTITVNEAIWDLIFLFFKGTYIYLHYMEIGLHVVCACMSHIAIPTTTV